MNASELSENLATLASQKIMDNLDNIFEGKAKFEDQNGPNGSKKIWTKKKKFFKKTFFGTYILAKVLKNEFLL